MVQPDQSALPTDFLLFMQHFVKHVRSSKDKKVLLLLDNHASHLSIKIIEFARDNGVVMLTFPPHCSHKLQPLDRSIYGPLKKYVSAAQDSWMRNNPGKGMTIYDIPALVKEALPRAMTPINIASGFRVSGIHPFQNDIFSDADFGPSMSTDQPNPSQRATATSSTTTATLHTSGKLDFSNSFMLTSKHSFTIYF